MIMHICPKCGSDSDQEWIDILFDDGKGEVRGNTHLVFCKKCNHQYKFLCKMTID